MDCSIRRAIYLLIVLGIVFFPPSGQAQAPLKLVNDPWPPYTGYSLPHRGLATNIVVTALTLSGYQTQVEFVPWKRALRGTFNGDYDILLTTTFSEERAKQVAYSKPYLSNTVKLLKNQGASHLFESLADLDGLHVVIMEGYLYEARFDAAKNFTKITGTNTVSNLRMLAANRVDLAVEDERVTRYYLKNNNSLKDLKVEFLPLALNMKNMHIIIRKTKPGYAKIITDFNRSLDRMRRDGTYEAIIKFHEPMPER